jgi:hypothetical protein
MIDVVNLLEPYYCICVSHSFFVRSLQSSPSVFRKTFSAYSLSLAPSRPLNRASQTLAKVPVRGEPLARFLYPFQSIRCRALDGISDRQTHNVPVPNVLTSSKSSTPKVFELSPSSSCPEMSIISSAAGDHRVPGAAILRFEETLLCAMGARTGAAAISCRAVQVAGTWSSEVDRVGLKRWGGVGSSWINGGA